MRRRRLCDRLQPKLLRHPGTQIHEGRLIVRFEQDLAAVSLSADARHRLAHRVLAQAALAQDG
eukprot:2290335-Alexandrium_andersonii.AAC.1